MGNVEELKHLLEQKEELIPRIDGIIKIVKSDIRKVDKLEDVLKSICYDEMTGVIQDNTDTLRIQLNERVIQDNIDTLRIQLNETFDKNVQCKAEIIDEIRVLKKEIKKAQRLIDKLNNIGTEFIPKVEA